MFATINGVPVTFAEFVILLATTNVPAGASRRRVLRIFDDSVMKRIDVDRVYETLVTRYGVGRKAA